MQRTLQWNQVEREGQGIRRTSNAGSAGSSPGQETKIAHSARVPKKKSFKKERVKDNGEGGCLSSWLGFCQC